MKTYQADYFKDVVTSGQQGWREVVETAVRQGISVPCLSSALSYFDGYCTETLQITCYKNSHAVSFSIKTGQVEV